MRIAAIGVVLPISEQGKKACRARGDAHDGTTSWRKVGATGEREPARVGPINRRQVLARECGGEHHRPGSLYAKNSIRLVKTAVGDGKPAAAGAEHDD
jgi:hypothetical protein